MTDRMKILVGMSGGIDSTYAALKLKNEGHDVEGAVLIMHDYTEIDAARAAAENIGIKLHTVDVRERFNEQVIPNFISEYQSGRTPNPCIICNGAVKFKYLLEYAEAHGFDRIATGHYARICRYSAEGDVINAISKAADAKKDQTYMLWRLSDAVRERLLLPLGDMKKDEIRLCAKEQGIAAADRPDSQEICFIPDNDYASYIEKKAGKSPVGNFIDESGKILGQHKGIIHYTVGQRKGLGISAASRIFVNKIDPKANTITLGGEKATDSTVSVSGVIYSGIPKMRIGDERRFEVKLRYHSAPVGCTVKCVSEGRAEAALDAPVKAATPGQSAVFYDGDLLAFGGFID